MTDIRPGGCVKASEEMLTTEHRLRVQIDTIGRTAAALRQHDSTSMHTAAEAVQRIANRLEQEAAAVRTLSKALEKIAGLYRGTEVAVTDYGDEVRYLDRIAIRSIDIGAIQTASAGIFEEF
ncbi:MAG: hypothetical protein IJH91_03905 [Mogibacterium sp.]|nr:hypothetical protein [Mogibacterium sp.]